MFIHLLYLVLELVVDTCHYWCLAEFGFSVECVGWIYNLLDLENTHTDPHPSTAPTHTHIREDRRRSSRSRQASSSLRNIYRVRRVVVTGPGGHACSGVYVFAAAYYVCVVANLPKRLVAIVVMGTVPCSSFTYHSYIRGRRGRHPGS